MSEVVIKIENLYKEYILGVIGYGTLKQDLASWWARIRGKEDPNSIIGQTSRFDKKNEHFLALNGISFEIKKGEAAGIIGKNGAGKSTLLKILSRITAPTKGKVKIKGRISSLLEVGTGFHPELTGRENIYLNGAILGMKKKEIDRKLDEIVNFSGIEKFIDTPVKRYSSGMYVRLAFSVAAHLDSDILILDEVLAVGDAEFQKKCLTKMDDITKNQGRTILFVSHNMVAVKNLCSRGILLKEGKIEYDGEVEETERKYFKELFNINNENKTEWINLGDFDNNQYIKIIRFAITDINGSTIKESNINNTDEVYVLIEFYMKETHPDLCIGYSLFDEQNNLLYISQQIDSNSDFWPNLKEGNNTIYSKLPTNILNSGKYLLKLTSSIYRICHIFDYHKEVPTISFNIKEKLSESKYLTTKRNTFIAPILFWYNKN